MKYGLLILLVLASVNSYAGLTKWVDKDGNVHYSDAPPPEGVKSESVRIQSPDEGTSQGSTPASGPAKAKSIYEMERDLNKERKAQEEADKKAAEKEKEAEAKQRNCAAAQNQLSTLRNAPRIATYDAQGNRSIMDDATREEQIRQAEASVSQFCD